MRRTKIVCTLGPNAENYDTLKKMAEYMDVGRFNFSHGSYQEHGYKLGLLDKVRIETGRPIAALLDTKGPEIRTGDFEGGRVVVENGQEFILTTENILGSKDKTYISYMNLLFKLIIRFQAQS